MKNITIQQAIFLLSTLTEKSQSLSSNLFNYKVPLTVNGKDVTDAKQSEQMIIDLQLIESLQKDIFTLKTKLAKTNTEVTFQGKTLGEYLEESRLKRSYLNNISNLLNSKYTKVENAVGVVCYGILNEDILRKKYQILESEVFTISQTIDTINANNFIEIDLINEN